jgi:hypothetical protein
MVEKKHNRADDLLNFELPSGKLLRDATKADLIEASAYYKAQAAEVEAEANDILKRSALINLPRIHLGILN